ncbi:MAG: glycosyltransferase family 39 protein, partial [Firmicutes bacterium]|nr:glycosyltransferase family 39 protein [Bacillota bacterium]
MKKQALLPLVIIIIAGAVWYSYYSKAFTHLFLNDAMDYASIGRNFARGDGLVSSYITPLGLVNKGGLPHPDLWRAPLWPAVLGLFIRLFGATEQAIAIGSGSFFIAGAGMVFLLAKDLFNRQVALISALLYILSAQNLLNSISGMTETISAFMMVLTVYLIVAPKLQNIWGDILAGVVLGLFYLTRYNAILFLPFFALFLWYRRFQSSRDTGFRANEARRVPGIWPVIRYLLAFALVISPWLIRNYLLMGSPLFSLQKYEPAMFTASYPGYSMYMTLHKIDVIGFLQPEFNS